MVLERMRRTRVAKLVIQTGVVLLFSQLPFILCLSSTLWPQGISQLPVRNVDLALDYLGDVILNDSGDQIQEEILQQVDLEHERDVRVSAFALEDWDQPRDHNIPQYERILIRGHPLAVRSTETLLTTEQRQVILQSAETHWQCRKGEKSSRFTIQRPGNYEVHTADLGLCEGLINPLLQHQIYPWLRESFSFHSKAPLCVYDSLIIRYNATEAKLSEGNRGASQPLHRDLGIFSINILLSESDRFQGGGTFFEHQLLEEEDDRIVALQPCQAGGAVAHFSSERHAGAATTSGVRDILVIFVLSTDPFALRAPRLKNYCLPHCQGDVQCRVRHHYLASRADPHDGEALLYVATALLEWASSQKNEKSLLQIAMECLFRASELCPCDARVWNNLGLTTGRLVHQHGRMDLAAQAEQAHATCLRLLHRTSQAGCEVSSDIDACRLNFGLFVSNLDRFEQAVELLEPLARRASQDPSNSLAAQAETLFHYCKGRSHVQ